jgi:hypothetical protein
MIRLPALCLAGCVVCAGLILSNDSPSFKARSPPAKTEPAAPEIGQLADPLFSPAQPPPEVPSSADDADSPLRDVRLTGVVIGPDLRIAIFAVTGNHPLELSEGEALKGWRLDSISPEKVLLSGPAGNIALKPKPDANLVRSPPVAVRADELGPSVPPSAVLAGSPGQPTAITPIPVSNYSAAIPVQAQGYPYYFPEYYAGYEQDGNGYPNDYWYYGYPVFGAASGIGFFGRHRFRNFHHFVFAHGIGFHGGFHGGGFHGGGFHGGGRR